MQAFKSVVHGCAWAFHTDSSAPGSQLGPCGRPRASNHTTRCCLPSCHLWGCAPEQQWRGGSSSEGDTSSANDRDTDSEVCPLDVIV